MYLTFPDATGSDTWFILSLYLRDNTSSDKKQKLFILVYNPIKNS